MYFEGARLARSGLELDPVHDNRHPLANGPTARESIPYMINLPDEGIAGFAYTWVDGKSSAGAILALFGPAIGDEPVVRALPDRPVPRDMDFSDWRIEDFSMRQDLEFQHADIAWRSDDVTVELRYDAFHPPYAYGSHKNGTPTFLASNRIEQSGHLTGRIVLNGRETTFSSLGHRDHSWGTRDWGALQHYNWFEGQTADGTAVHFWRYIALGQIELRGYVFKDGLLAEVTDLAMDLRYSDDLRQQHMIASVTDEAGRSTTVEAEFYAHYTLVPDLKLHLREGAARATFDGRRGIGWMEVAWPPSYLEHVAANGPY